MNEQSLTDVDRAFIEVRKKLARIEAYNYGLTTVVRMLARQQDLSDKKVQKIIENYAEASYQVFLESLEDQNPALASIMDDRRAFPELPDELL